MEQQQQHYISIYGNGKIAQIAFLKGGQNPISYACQRKAFHRNRDHELLQVKKSEQALAVVHCVGT